MTWRTQFSIVKLQKFLMINIKDCVIKENISLKDYCTFKIGGNAKFLFECFSVSSLMSACQFCTENNIKFKVIGFGANLLFSDEGYSGAIIVNRTSKLNIRKNFIYADSGLAVSSLINKCFLKELAGLENLSGIPSTVGGAIVNSLGAHNTNFCDYVEWVECFNKNNPSKLFRIKANDCQFGYRTSLFKTKTDYILTKVKLKLDYGNKAHIRCKIIEAISKKISSQPLDMPSAGSVFKRCDIIPAKVIDELGFKGYTIGGAQVSTKHAGFIVNLGNATSKDVETLINAIKNKILNAYNILIEPEIELVKN